MIRKGGYFMELKEAILTRRSVRGYTGQEVSRETIREILGIPEGKRIVTGISIGYEDPSFAANAVISPRENIDDITEWFGL